ncbi:hypothetical protein ABZ766_15645 [Streptomyces sp. NPDC006670]|uniref:hypothetical protein n=1 Tax=Streptomyces sp. NPDC006670 TaxID=3154476 RepID=UPI0033E70415
MARRIRKNSVRLGVAAIVVAAVTGGVVLPATTAMAAPATEVITAPFEVDPFAPPHDGPDKAPPNPYEAPPVVTWGTGTPPAESDTPQEESEKAPPAEEPEGPPAE